MSGTPITRKNVPEGFLVLLFCAALVGNGCATAKITSTARPCTNTESIPYTFKLSDAAMQKRAHGQYPSLFPIGEVYSNTISIDIALHSSRRWFSEVQQWQLLVACGSLGTLPGWAKSGWSDSVSVSADSLLGARHDVARGKVDFVEYKWFTLLSPIGLLPPPGRELGTTTVKRFELMPKGHPLFEEHCAVDWLVQRLAHGRNLDGIVKEQNIMRGISVPELTATALPAIVADIDARGISASNASALSERLRMQVYRAGYFVILSRADMDRVLAEQQLSISEHCSSTECLVELGKLLEVEIAIGCKLELAHGRLSAALRAIDVREQKVVAEVSDGLTIPQAGSDDVYLSFLRWMSGRLLCAYHKNRESVREVAFPQR